MSLRWAGVLAVLAAAVTITGESGLLAADPVPTADSGRRSLPLARGVSALVCPGPETLAVPEGAEAVAPGGPVLLRAMLVGPEGTSVGSFAAAAGTVGPMLPAGQAAPAPVSLRPAAGTSAGLVQTPLAKAGPLRLDADTGDGAPPRFAVLQSTLAPDGDLRGLTATECGEASADQWLVGGGTGDGRRGRLLLANPTSSPAVVDVTVLGPAGPVTSPAGQDVLVPAGGQQVLLLDALAPGLASTAVHVTTRSGRVTAVLHDSVLRGLVPGGVDEVAPAATPARTQWVPGVSVVGLPGPDGDRVLVDDATAPGATAVRVAVPGADDAIVRVSLVGPSGEVELGAAGVRTVPAGTTADLPVTGVDRGVYTVLVQADVPVVAGAVVGRGSAGSEKAGTDQDPLAKAPPAELGWAAATAPLAGSRLVTLPAQSSPQPAAKGRPAVPAAVQSWLTLTATDGPVSVQLTDLDAAGKAGQVRTVQVPDRTSSTVQLTAGLAGVLVDPGSTPGLHAALTLVTPDGVPPMVSVVPLGPVGTAPGVTPIAVQDPALGVDLSR
jgi:hypothetical protein